MGIFLLVKQTVLTHSSAESINQSIIAASQIYIKKGSALADGWPLAYVLLLLCWP